MTLYDLNKAQYATMPKMDDIAVSVNSFDIAEKLLNGARYWMLLCNDRKDYTVFDTNNATKEMIAKDVRECLAPRGEVLEITAQEDGAYEIWIRDPESREAFVYYLFDYSFGIVVCGEES